AARSNVCLPLDAGEIHAPSISVLRRPLSGSRFLQDLPWQPQLERPTVVMIAGVIESAFDNHRDLQSIDVPAVHRRTAIAVRLDEHQLPWGCQRVDLELVVRVCVTVRTDEDFGV